MEFKKMIVVCGHYGSGKTNLCLNIAKVLRTRGEPVTVVDLDIVNPYFRTADYKGWLEQRGIDIVASEFASGNLDIPALPPALYAVFQRGGTVIIDVGGDDAGAAALGRFSHLIMQKDYEMMYVVNGYRALTADAADAVALLREIEQTGRVKATGIANNSHLGELTTREDIDCAKLYAEEVARVTGLPLLFTAVRDDLAQDDEFPVEVIVHKPWE